jgi:hypothetical protein
MKWSAPSNPVRQPNAPHPRRPLLPDHRPYGPSWIGLEGDVSGYAVLICIPVGVLTLIGMMLLVGGGR